MASPSLWASRAASFLKISVPHRGFATAVAAMEGLKFSDRHSWVKVGGHGEYYEDYGDNVATVGITHHRTSYLGVPFFVELPEVGDELTQGDPFCEYQTVRGDVDLYSPISGKVVDVNDELFWNSSMIANECPYTKGWLAKVEMKDASELEKLMDADSYSKFVGEEKEKEKEKQVV